MFPILLESPDREPTESEVGGSSMVAPKELLIWGSLNRKRIREI